MSLLRQNPNFQLTTTALLSITLTAATILGYQHLRRDKQLSDLKASIPEWKDDGRRRRGDQVCAFEVEGEVELKWKGRLMGEVKLVDVGRSRSREDEEIKEDKEGLGLEEGEKVGKGDNGAGEGLVNGLGIAESKEDKRSRELAERARRGDYDDGKFYVLSPNTKFWEG